MPNNTQKQLLKHFLGIPVLNLFSVAFPFENFKFSTELISEIDENEEEILFELPDTILGKQAEAIFEFLVEQSKNYDLLVTNIQIFEDAKTIGELDYLIKNLENFQMLHVELACKFYLFDNQNHNTFEGKWIGCNRKDTLLDKVIKLKTKQFPLLYSEAAAMPLNIIGFDHKIAFQQYYLASSLYVPKGFDISELPANYQSCIVGYWIHFKDLKLDENCNYAIPSKREWLFPAEHITEWFSAEKAFFIISDSIEKKKSPQVYQKRGNVVEKFFVVWWRRGIGNR